MALMPHEELILCLSRIIFQPQNWLPNCFELIQTIHVNMNIKILDHYELLQVLDNPSGKCEDNNKILHWLSSFNGISLNRTAHEKIDGNSVMSMDSANDSENYIMELLIR